MTLKDWLNNGWLVEHKTSPQEINQFLSLAESDLKNSDVAGLDLDWQLKIAYSAALCLANAALAASGFRATHDNSHHRIIGSLAHTIGAEKRLVDTFDAFRKKRNISQYETAGMVSDTEAREMKALARELERRVTACLKTNHPELLPKE